MKFIKHSEYSVVERLNKLSAQISLLALLLNSKPHHKALMIVLSEAYVAHNILVEKVDQFVSNIVVSNVIAFTDDEIPFRCRGKTKALLDNESSMNVIPMATFSHLPVDLSHIRKTHLVVRAFDGTRKEVIRNMELPIQIGPCIFNIDTQVMDINPSCNYMLERY